MRRFAAFALMVAGLALPACAQRGMGHGGFSGSSASAFHGGFAAPHFSGGFSAPRTYGFGGNFRAPVRSFSATPFSARSFAAAPRSNFRSPYSGAGYGNGRGARYGNGRGYYRYRRTYSSFPFYSGLPFYGVPGWLGLGSGGYYPDDSGYGDSAASGYDDSAAYGGDAESSGQDQGPPPEQPGFRPDYAPASEAPPPAPEVSAVENATTLVFNDGRPPEKVHNYALTRTTLFVLDEQRQDIPVAQLDLTATEKVNRAAGIEFKLPKLPE